ncbi:MAG: hypothetical protein IJX70_06135, partial [Clostridia bacterium]|nr:hypothetical protein [Clostridia bacterium]
MKKLVFVSILLVAVMAVSLVGCITTDGTTVTLNRDLDFKLEVGEQVDFADYFIITDADGNRVDVTSDMLDLSKIDLSTPGTYVVTLTFGDTVLEAIFIVEEKMLPECTEHVDEDGDELCDNCGAAVPNPDPECTEHVDEDKDELCDKCGAAVPNPDPTPDLEALFAEVAAKYDSYDKWNFKAHYTIADSSEVFSDIYYQFLGDDLELSYDYDGETYTEYLEFVAADDAYFYYFDNGDGTYLKMDENHEYFYDYFSYVDYLELYELGGFAFAVKGDGYTAVKPNELGNLVLGEYDGSVWDSFDLWLNENNQISKIVAKATETVDGQSASYTYTIEFSGYGEADFDIAGLVLDGGETPEPDCTEHVDEDENGLCDNCGAAVSIVDPDAPTVDLSEVFVQYDHYADWNFFVDFACSVDGEAYSQALYGMMGIDT